MDELTRRSVLKRSLGAGIASLASTAWARATSDKIGPRERAAIAAAANAFIKEYNIPGASVAIARNERLAYAQGFGIADARTGELTTPTHLFRIASVTKPITSVAIWPNGPDDPMSKDMNQHELISWTLDNMPLANPPGTNFIYSNFGYYVLGLVIERTTRQPYEAYVRESVLARCGITAMRIGGSTLSERADGEVVYYHTTGNPYAKDMARIDSTGGWIASALDLVRFAMHVDSFPGVRNILQPATITTMTTPTVHPRYARGWGVNEGTWWHDGILPGTSVQDFGSNFTSWG